MKMTYNQAVEAIDEFMNTSLCVSGEVEGKAREALEYLKSFKWHPVTGDGDDLPATDENGESDLVMISFDNFGIPIFGVYTKDDDGRGAFHDENDGGYEQRTLGSYGLIVNAWAPLPDKYNE